MAVPQFAATYGLVGLCKMNGIDPRAHQTHMATHIAKHEFHRIEYAATLGRVTMRRQKK